MMADPRLVRCIGATVRLARVVAGMGNHRPFAVALALVMSAASVLGAQGASLTGRVTAAGTSEPVPDARVIVLGTNLFGITGSDGRYTIRNVPSGSVDVRVLRVGYREQKKTTQVVAGQANTLDFVMEPSVVKLQEVVTTATGEQRRVELGNTVGVVNAAELTRTAPIARLDNLLTARVPGVVVSPPNMTGGTARVRIRGAGSLILANDPIYIIDGVRMTSDAGSSSLSSGGTLPSRANDIHPEDIEDIEIVKGPSAATLYGTDAANGVIVITTKRGRAGAARWNVFAEGGVVTDRNTYPTAYTLAGHSPGSTVNRSCRLTQIAAGSCIADSLRTYNLFDDPDVSPVGTGHRQNAGVSVSGGTEAVRYYSSLDAESEYGVARIPSFFLDYWSAKGRVYPGEQVHPNAYQRFNTRTNLSMNPTSTMDLAFNFGFIASKQRLPQTDNNTTGILSNAYGGPGFTTNGNTTDGVPLHGYRRFVPSEIFQEVLEQKIGRFIGSVNASWRPSSWLSNRVNAGLDQTDRIDTDLCRFGDCSDFGTQRLGFAQDNRADIRNVSLDLASSATYAPYGNVSTKTTIGAQYVHYLRHGNLAVSQILAPGAETVTAGSIFGASEQTVVTKTLGAFVEEQVGFRDRLFVTAAVRSDQNSAFGTNFQRVYYPKFGVSWLVSDESFFPKVPRLDQLRLRLSMGASGVQPGPNDAERFYTPALFNRDNSDNSGLSALGVGNVDLRPERATELETGFDARFFSGRISTELTYYNKVRRDALIPRVLPPSSGTGVSVRNENIGRVRNAGVEALINAQLVDVDRLGWSVTLNGSINHNRLVTLGDVPPIVGAITRAQEGYPLFGWWERRISNVRDANGDGIITLGEFTVDDSASFIGESAPTRELSLTNSFDLFRKMLRLTALFEYRGGHYLLNDTERIRCQVRSNCQGLTDRSASLEDQARVVAVREHPSQTEAGFIEPANFVRWRELSLTFAPSGNLGRLLHAESASLTFAARNLKKWTNYSGIDPESDYNQFGNLPTDFQTSPAPSYFTVRLNLGF
jgi:TonB-linked SusC/RagA family outer membrane protein